MGLGFRRTVDEHGVCRQLAGSHTPLHAGWLASPDPSRFDRGGRRRPQQSVVRKDVDRETGDEREQVDREQSEARRQLVDNDKECREAKQRRDHARTRPLAARSRRVPSPAILSIGWH